jgi:hypothetical protein
VKITTQKALEKATKYWQRVLRLQDWDIKISFSRPPNMPDDCYGISCVMPMYRRSTIKILHPKYNTAMVQNDLEATVIHELLHCHTHTIRMSRSSYEEFVIQALAEGFIDAKYNRRHDYHPPQ